MSHSRTCPCVSRQCFSVTLHVKQTLQWALAVRANKNGRIRAVMLSGVWDKAAGDLTHVLAAFIHTKGKLSTPLHPSNPQATKNFRIVIRIQSFSNPNQKKAQQIRFFNTRQWLAVPTVSCRSFRSVQCVLPCGNTHVSVFVLSWAVRNKFARQYTCIGHCHGYLPWRHFSHSLISEDLSSLISEDFFSVEIPPKSPPILAFLH